MNFGDNGLGIAAPVSFSNYRRKDNSKLTLPRTANTLLFHLISAALIALNHHPRNAGLKIVTQVRSICDVNQRHAQNEIPDNLVRGPQTVTIGAERRNRRIHLHCFFNLELLLDIPPQEIHDVIGIAHGSPRKFTDQTLNFSFVMFNQVASLACKL